MKSVLLLQIVMVNPGTHLVKNHESRPITNQSQIKEKKGVILRPLCNQTVNLETDAKTLYYSSLIYIYIYSPSKYLKHKKLICNFKQRPEKSHNRMFYQKIFKSFSHSLHPTKGGIPHDVMNYFVSLRIFYASGTQDAEVTKSL